MGSSEKDRLAAAVVDHWCTFQAARTGPTRKYPTQAFNSFADAARRYIDVTRHDRLIHREVVNAIRGLTDELRLERGMPDFPLKVAALA